MNDLMLSVAQYATHLERDYLRGFLPADVESAGRKYSIDIVPARKFIRVEMVSWGSRSIHSFVVIEPFGKFVAGDILKAASWNAPAKNFRRGNVFDVDSYVQRTRWSGVS